MSRQPGAGALPAPYQGLIDLAEGRTDGRIPAAFSSGVTGWFSSPEQGVAFELDRLRGAPAISRSIASLGPCAVEVLGSVVDARQCWGELALRGHREPDTCLVQFALDGEARVGEVVWLRAAAVPRPARGGGECSHDARRTLEAYFEDLQASRFDSAAARFAPDGIYSHPPYRPGAARVLWHGRNAIRDGFVHERGESPVRQTITDGVQCAGRAFIRGVVDGVPNGGGGTFLSTAELGESGEITRYVAFYSAVRF